MVQDLLLRQIRVLLSPYPNCLQVARVRFPVISSSVVVEFTVEQGATATAQFTAGAISLKYH